MTQRQQQIPKVEKDLVSGPKEARLQQILQQHHKRLQNLKQTQSPKEPGPEVKNLPEAKAVIEIGKVGSSTRWYQDVDGSEVAKPLTVRMMNSGTALKNETGGDGNALGIFRPSPFAKGYGGRAIRVGGSFKRKGTLEALNIICKMATV